MISALNNKPISAIKFGDDKQTTKPSSDKTLSGVPLRGTKRLNYSPVTVGALNGVCWFGVGMLLDKLYAKLFKSKLNTKVSLAIQGAFGLFMGYQAYKVAKNENKSA